MSMVINAFFGAKRYNLDDLLNPILYLPFNGDILDYSGNFRDATAADDYEFTKTRVNTKEIFLTTDTELECDVESFPDDITISFWVRGDLQAPTPFIDGGALVLGGKYLLGFITSDWSFDILYRTSSWANLNDSTWYFISFTYDYTNDSFKFYVNGSLLYIATIDKTSGFTNTILEVFKESGTGYVAECYFSDFLIWDKILSAPEISSIYSILKKNHKFVDPSLDWIVFQFNVTSSLTIPFVDFANTVQEIDWGDGSTTSTNTHTYASAGTYTVKIKPKTGKNPSFLWNNGGDKDLITKGIQWGAYMLGGDSNANAVDFYGCTNLDLSEIRGVPKLNNNLFTVFRESGVGAINNIENWEWENVTAIGNTFRECLNLTNIYINAKNMTTISGLFNLGRFEELVIDNIQSGLTLGTAFNFYLVGGNNVSKIILNGIDQSFDVSRARGMTKASWIELAGSVKDLTGLSSQTVTIYKTGLNPSDISDIEAAFAAKNWTVAP